MRTARNEYFSRYQPTEVEILCKHVSYVCLTCTVALSFADVATNEIFSFAIAKVTFNQMNKINFWGVKSYQLQKIIQLAYCALHHLGFIFYKRTFNQLMSKISEILKLRVLPWQDVFYVSTSILIKIVHAESN